MYVNALSTVNETATTSKMEEEEKEGSDGVEEKEERVNEEGKRRVAGAEGEREREGGSFTIAQLWNEEVSYETTAREY